MFSTEWLRISTIGRHIVAEIPHRGNCISERSNVVRMQKVVLSRYFISHPTRQKMHTTPLSKREWFVMESTAGGWKQTQRMGEKKRARDQDLKRENEMHIPSHFGLFALLTIATSLQISQTFHGFLFATAHIHLRRCIEYKISCQLCMKMNDDSLFYEVSIRSSI